MIIKISYSPIPNDKNALYKGNHKIVKIDNNNVDAFDYADIFGKDSVLRYTPQLNSVQKDSILNKYTGQNEFKFIFSTYGDKAVLSEDNRFINIVDDKTNEIVTTLSPLFAYDSYKGDDTDFDHFTQDCEYKLVEIKPCVYEMTFVISKEFLENPQTIYPVTIDPAPTVSNGYDSAVYSKVSYVNYQNTTMGSGHSLDYGAARSYVKFTFI